jgi:hypothetical protein
VLALSDPPSYGATDPDCDTVNADCNGDGRVDFADLGLFRRALAGEDGQGAVPDRSGASPPHDRPGRLDNGPIYLFWSTTGISDPNYVYSTALTNFLPYFVPWTHPGQLSDPLILSAGTCDLFLWGQFSAGSADYDRIIGLDLGLINGGSATHTPGAAYRHKWGAYPLQR